MIRRNLYYIIPIAAVGLILLWVVIKNNKERSSIIKLIAKVNYDNKKFVVTNTDTIDFVDAQLSIDEHWKLTKLNLKVGESYDIWQVEFIHYNGTHYPSKLTPRQFSIWCETPNGNNGFYSKRVN